MYITLQVCEAQLEGCKYHYMMAFYYSYVISFLLQDSSNMFLPIENLSYYRGKPEKEFRDMIEDVRGFMTMIFILVT
jgi:hypothetical protein